MRRVLTALRGSVYSMLMFAAVIIAVFAATVPASAKKRCTPTHKPKGCVASGYYVATTKTSDYNGHPFYLYADKSGYSINDVACDSYDVYEFDFSHKLIIGKTTSFKKTVSGYRTSYNVTVQGSVKVTGKSGSITVTSSHPAGSGDPACHTTQKLRLRHTRHAPV